MPRRFNSSTLGALSAFLLIVTVVAAIVTTFTIPTTENPRDDTLEWLQNVSTSRDHAMGAVWLFALSGPFLVGMIMGLYHRLNSWGQPLLHAALFASVAAAIFLAISSALLAVSIDEIVPVWSATDDAALRSSYYFDARILAWTSDALLSMAGLCISAACITTSLVMLRTQIHAWRVLGWLGITGGIAPIFGAFGIAEERFDIGDYFAVVLLLAWSMGVGLSLWQSSNDPALAEQAETADGAYLPSPGR